MSASRAGAFPAMCRACPQAVTGWLQPRRAEGRAAVRFGAWTRSSRPRCASGRPCRTATAGWRWTRAATGTCATSRCRRPGPFPQVKGSRIEHDGLRGFIQRNYEADARGCWFFQNGPQRVYVELEAAPWVFRLDAASRRPASRWRISLPGERQALLPGRLAGRTRPPVPGLRPGFRPGAQPGHRRARRWPSRPATGSPREMEFARMPALRLRAAAAGRRRRLEPRMPA